MTRLLSILILSLLPVLSPAAEPPNTKPVAYVAVFPSPAQLSNGHKTAVLNGLNTVIARANPGDRVSVYDATRQVQIAGFTIPDSSPRHRPKRLQPHLQAIMQAFNHPEPTDPSVKIDLPRFMREAFSTIHDGGSETRVLIYADLFDACGEELSASFRPGEYPGDGFINGSYSDMSWGTEGRGGEAEGVRFYWCYLNDVASNQEREAAIQFYGKWFNALGGTLARPQSEGQAASLIGDVMTGKVSSPITARVDPNDKVLAIRNVGEAFSHRDTLGPKLDEARRRVARRARQLVEALLARDLIRWGQPTRLVIVPDASASWSAIQPTVHATIEVAARTVPDYRPYVEVSVIPFRDALLKRFPLSRIKPFGADKGASQESLSAYLATLTADASKVNIEAVVQETLAELEASPTDGRTVWCFITDQDPREWDPSNHSGARRVAEAVRAWSKLGDHRVVTVYVGDKPQGAEARFLKSVAAAAGDNGFYADDVEALIDTLLEATLLKPGERYR